MTMGLPLSASMYQPPQQQQQQSWMDKLFGMGGQDPTQNMMGMAMRMLAGSQGQGFGKPAQGFGQGIGNAWLGQQEQALKLEQIAYRNQMEKDRIAVAKDAQEAREQYYKDLADFRAREEEIATQRWVASINADTQRAAQREAGEERRHKETMGRIDASRSDTGAIGDYMDFATRPVEQGGAGWTADQSLNRYLNRGNSMFGFGQMGGGTPGFEPDIDLGAQIEAGIPGATTQPQAAPAPFDGPFLAEAQKKQLARDMSAEEYQELMDKYGPVMAPYAQLLRYGRKIPGFGQR